MPHQGISIEDFLPLSQIIGPLFPHLWTIPWLGLVLSGIYFHNPSLLGLDPNLDAPSDCSAQIYALETGKDQAENDLTVSQMLIDPVLSTPQEIDKRLQLVEALHTCLEDGLEKRDPDGQRLYTLAEFFLIFAGGYQSSPENSTCYRTDLATSDDPAVVALRDRAQIPAPAGYVYVCFYESGNATPVLVGRAFEDPNVKGVTFLTRYIAILDEKKATWPEQALQNQTLPLTVSHELVHAYINSALGVKNFGDMPLWYQEGVAIYFSGSGEENRVVTPNFSISQTSPQDYRQYDLNFKYLQAKLGKPHLLELIRRSVLQADASILLQDLSIKDGAQLADLSTAWADQRTQRRLWLTLGGALLIGWILVSLAPEAECVCGYQGRKNDFREGNCPRCGRHIFQPPSVARRMFSIIVPACEICGRRFLPRHKKELEHYQEPFKVWTETRSVESGERLRAIYARNVCTRCAGRSVEIEAEKLRQVRMEIEKERPSLHQVYLDWLSAAPSLPDTLEGWAQGMTLEDALEQFILAALERRYYAWMQSHADFQFVDRSLSDENRRPPRGYDQVIRKISYQDGAEIALLGSIYRFGKDRIGIVWNP